MVDLQPSSRQGLTYKQARVDIEAAGRHLSLLMHTHATSTYFSGQAYPSSKPFAVHHISAIQGVNAYSCDKPFLGHTFATPGHWMYVNVQQRVCCTCIPIQQTLWYTLVRWYLPAVTPFKSIHTNIYSEQCMNVSRVANVYAASSEMSTPGTTEDLVPARRGFM